MKPQTPWNRGADTIEVAEILTAMRQGAFEPVRSSRITLALARAKLAAAPNRVNDEVTQTPMTRDAEVDQAAETLVAMRLSGTSEAVDAAGAVEVNIPPTQPTAVITSQIAPGSDTESFSEAAIVYDYIDDTTDVELIEIDDDENINENDDDEHREDTVEPPWLPHLRRTSLSSLHEEHD